MHIASLKSIPFIVFPDTDLMFLLHMFIHNMQCTFKYLYAGERLFMPAGASEILEIL